MPWPKGKPRKAVDEGAASAALSASQETQEREMEKAEQEAPEAKMVKVQVLRDYWDANGERQRAAWMETTNEREVDPETGKVRPKRVNHPAAVIEVTVDEAERGIDIGFFKAFLR